MDTMHRSRVTEAEELEADEFDLLTPQLRDPFRIDDAVGAAVDFARGHGPERPRPIPHHRPLAGRR